MRGYGQYCPVARSAEVLGDRWTLLIVREMMHGVSRFNELERCLPGISRSVLSQRLRHLQTVGVVVREGDDTHRSAEDRPPPGGRPLRPVWQPRGDWAATWAFGEPRAAELDPDLVVRWISRHLARDQLPSHRVVVAFEVLGRGTRWYWLGLESDDVSICRHDPGFRTDVTIRSAAEPLYRVYLGSLSLGQAQRAGRMELSGGSDAVRDAPRWFAWSTFAPAIRGAAERRAAATALQPTPV